VGQSIIGGVTFSALPSVLRDRGLPLDQIGLTYLAVLPWVMKFLWAPAIERYRLPSIGPSRSRSIVLIGGLISSVCFVLAAIVGPASFVPLMAIFIVVAFAASTVDIACDGHAVESLPSGITAGATPLKSAVPTSGRRSARVFSLFSSRELTGPKP
jgi:MFS transporter (putative signal transducer)